MDTPPPQKANPDVTIVITTYQRPKLLRKAVANLISQDFTHWELLIVDDESKDTTPEVIAELVGSDPRIRGIRQRNQGHVVGRATAMFEASPSSRFLLFHDDDDWLFPGALGKLVSLAEEHPDAPAVHGIALSVDPEGNIEPAPDRHPGYLRRGFKSPTWVASVAPEAPETLSTLLVWCAIQTPGQVLVRRSCFDAVGGFDTTLPVSEDWDLYLRLARLAPIPRMLDPVIHRLVHPGNMTRRGAFMRQGEMVRRKFVRDPTLNRSERTMAALGGLAAAGETLHWALDSLRSGRPIEAVRQLTRALRRIWVGLGYLPHLLAPPLPRRVQ